jgi:hypothetical protein
MQGQTALANVVRRREAQTRGSIEAEIGILRARLPRTTPGGRSLAPRRKT